MINQDDTSGRPFDINQLQWALQYDQKIDGVEGIVLSSQTDMVADNDVNKKVDNNSVLDKTSLHNTVLEERIEKLGQSLNREMVSLKGEFAIVAQGTGLEEQIEKLGESLNQEFLLLKSEIGIVAQSAAVEEQINKLGESLNQEILSLKGEFGIVAQGTVVEEQIDKLGQSLHQELLSLKSEFAMLVQTQFNQEKTWQIVEIEWKNSMKDREVQFQADIREMQHNIIGKVDEHFQYLDAQFQDHDNMIRQELSLLTSQLVELQQAQNSKEELQVTPWQRKLEERQTRLIEDVDYVQYVLEEIATHPQNNEAQQKLREKFFIREISGLKEEIAVVCQKWKTMSNECRVTDVEQYNKNLPQQGINPNGEDQTKVYKKRKKRRY